MQRLSRNVIVEQHSADVKLLIETMKLDIEQVVSKSIETVYQNGSYKYALLDNFLVSGSLRSEEANTKLDCRLAAKKYRKAD